MSTGAECNFYEEAHGKWFYEISECDCNDPTTKGPFTSFRAAERHLSRNYANPGGYGVDALPGCKHEDKNCQGECNYCGDVP